MTCQSCSRALPNKLGHLIYSQPLWSSPGLTFVGNCQITWIGRGLKLNSNLNSAAWPTSCKRCICKLCGVWILFRSAEVAGRCLNSGKRINYFKVQAPGFTKVVQVTSTALFLASLLYWGVQVTTSLKFFLFASLQEYCCSLLQMPSVIVVHTALFTTTQYHY